MSHIHLTANSYPADLQNSQGLPTLKRCVVCKVGTLTSIYDETSSQIATMPAIEMGALQNSSQAYAPTQTYTVYDRLDPEGLRSRAKEWTTSPETSDHATGLVRHTVPSSKLTTSYHATEQPAQCWAQEPDCSDRCVGNEPESDTRDLLKKKKK